MAIPCLSKVDNKQNVYATFTGDSAGQGSIDYTIYKLFTNTRTTVSYFNIKDGIVRQSLTRLKVPRSYNPMKRRFETTQ